MQERYIEFVRLARVAVVYLYRISEGYEKYVHQTRYLAGDRQVELEKTHSKKKKKNKSNLI